MKLIVECSQKLVRLGENLWGKEQELDKAEPLDVPTMTTDFVKEHGLPCPEGYIFKDENGNVINATKIVLEKKGLTKERINAIVHESCILFCKHCGCGVPRDTCTSLGTCDEHDEYRSAIRAYLMNKYQGTSTTASSVGMMYTQQH